VFLNLVQIWNHINFLLRKEKEGKTLTPKQYNDLLTVVNFEVFQAMWVRYENDITITDSLVRFIVDETLTTSVSQDYVESLNFPTDYYHLISLKTSGDIPIDLCTELEWNELRDDPVIGATATSPRARMVYDQGQKQIRVLPSSATDFDITYMRRPATPYFDYCIDNTTDEILYMEVGWIITAGGALEDGSSNVISAAVTHPDSPSLPYTSVSIEFDYEPQDVDKAKNLILQKVSLSNKQDSQHAYAAQKEIQLNTE